MRFVRFQVQYVQHLGHLMVSKRCAHEPCDKLPSTDNTAVHWRDDIGDTILQVDIKPEL